MTVEGLRKRELTKRARGKGRGGVGEQVADIIQTV